MIASAQTMELYRNELELLIADAMKDGLVVTVEQRSLQPLAMGHYEHVVTVRLARERTQ